MISSRLCLTIDYVILTGSVHQFSCQFDRSFLYVCAHGWMCMSVWGSDREIDNKRNRETRGRVRAIEKKERKKGR